MADFYMYVLYLNYLLLFIAGLVGVFKFNILKKVEKQYFFYIIFILLIEAINNILTRFFNFLDTSFLYPYYILGDFLLLTTLFIRKLNLSNYWLGCVFILAIAFLSNNLFFNIFSNDYGKVISNIIIVCFSGFVLLQEIRKGASNNRFVLLDASIFFYYSVSVFVFIIQEQIANLLEDDYYLILGINNLFSSFVYVLYIYTFLRLKK